MIAVQKIVKKGRGIIATQDIPKETLIEVAPVADFPLQQKLSVNEKEAFQYYFVKPSEYDKDLNKNGYLVFGLASLCNHADEPNSRVDWVENKIGLWSHLIATKDIKKGEELTLFYANINEYIYAEKFV